MSESDATRNYLIYGVESLSLYFQSRRNVYVSGNLFIYYREGDTSQSISPDVFVIFGVSKRQRRSYKTWQEGHKLPSFVLEITSLSTKKQDEVEKPELYASLNVQEYFQYDPTGDYLTPQLKGRSLVNGRYQDLPLVALSNGIQAIHSSVLGLDLRLQPPQPQPLTLVQSSLPLELRFHDPQTDAPLLSYREIEQAREQAEQERNDAEQARLEAIPRLLAMGLTPAQVAEALQIAIDQINRIDIP